MSRYITLILALIHLHTPPNISLFTSIILTSASLQADNDNSKTAAILNSETLLLLMLSIPQGQKVNGVNTH